MTDKTVAMEILKQLGGNRFIAMTGAKNFLCDKNSLSFKIGRNAASVNYIRIELEPSDTYSVKFENVKITKKGVIRKEIHNSEGVYFDGLQELFTSVTGMHTRLF